jgi:hypothetical protein
MPKHITRMSRKTQTGIKQMNPRTIDALLTIMDDPDIVAHRRIEAAETLLGF